MTVRFWILTFASGLSKIGNSFLYVAVPFAILSTTESPLLAILSLGVQSVPYIASPVIGILIDKYDRRFLFAISELFQALCVLMIPWLLSMDQLAGVFICLLLVGLGAATAGLTSDFGLIPSLVSEDKIDWAFSRYTAVQQIARLAGPAMAGFVIAFIGTSWALYADAATFLLTVFASLLLPAAAAKPVVKKTVSGLLRDGFQSFWKRDDIKHLTSALTVYNIGTGSLFAAMLTVATVWWDWDAKTVGLVLSGGAASSALGAWVSAALFKHWQPQSRIAFWLGLCAFGGISLLLASPIPVLIGFYVISFGEGGMNVVTMSYRQKTIASEYAGRINAIIRMFVMGAIPLSSLFLGAVGDLAKGSYPVMQFLPVALISCLAFGIWWRWLSKSKRAGGAISGQGVTQ